MKLICVWKWMLGVIWQVQEASLGADSDRRAELMELKQAGTIPPLATPPLRSHNTMQQHNTIQQHYATKQHHNTTASPVSISRTQRDNIIQYKIIQYTTQHNNNTTTTQYNSPPCLHEQSTTAMYELGI